MAPTRVVSAARVSCYINGAPFGQVASISYRSITPKKPIFGLDFTGAQELAITQSKFSVSMRLYRIHSLREDGVAAGVHDLPREKYFSIMLVDRSSDTVIMSFSYCSLNSQSWEVSAKGLVMGTIEFEAI